MRAQETTGLILDDVCRGIERIQEWMGDGAPAAMDAEILEIVDRLRDLEKHLISSGHLDKGRSLWRPIRWC
tara:strand:+ start:3155 stop:3367 length:213 start_codon:yes stop_codon:yes gene_type:complete